MIIIREILFKAKCIDGGNWIYGDLIHHTYGTCIGVSDDEGLHELFIDDSTICQYTGITDKNGKRIWENDIVKTNNGRVCKVIWFSSPQYQGWDLIPLESVNPAPSKNNLWEELEVIDNSFDNS